MSTVPTQLPQIDNPFFLVTGLPVHTLIVHFAVVMLPLSAIALIAIILVPRWRGAFLWAAMVGLVIGTGAAFIAMLSGQALAEAIGVPQNHSRWGDVLPWLGLLLLALAILWDVLWRRSVKPDPLPRISMGSGLLLVVGIVAIVVSIVVMGLTVVVGHTGAEAVWKSRSLDSEAVEDSPTPAPTASAPASAAPSSSAGAAGGLTAAEVAKHSTPQDCWSIVTGKVYDLTQWIPQHPGGPGVIEGMCGGDGTAAYEGQHQGSSSAAAALAQFEIGTLGGALPGAAASAAPAASASASAAPASSAAAAAAAGAITAANVAQHSTPQDCWSIVTTNVYDLTQWISQHPGGPGVIEGMCGIDGTATYNSQHQGDKVAAGALQQFLLGPVG
jgi:cytochrome b involved in lipid metabolism/uncharacterized membrane protein